VDTVLHPGRMLVGPSVIAGPRFPAPRGRESARRVPNPAYGPGLST